MTQQQTERILHRLHRLPTDAVIEVENLINDKIHELVNTAALLQRMKHYPSDAMLEIHEFLEDLESRMTKDAERDEKK